MSVNMATKNQLFVTDGWPEVCIPVDSWFWALNDAQKIECLAETHHRAIVKTIEIERKVMATNTSVWTGVRRAVYERDGAICHYCGCDCTGDETIDHIVPVSKGGPTTLNNCVIACRSCNSRKGAR